MTRESTKPTDAVAINAVLVAVRQAADVICDRWVLTLISAALLGERRFGGFMARTGMASRVVASRLRTLEALGIFVRTPYQLRPLRHEYRLSVMGEAFLGIILQMIRWEQLWPSRSSVAGGAVHPPCGSALRPDLRCAACGIATSVRDIELSVSRAQLRAVPEKRLIHRRLNAESATPNRAAVLLTESLDIFGDKWTVEIVMCAFFRVRRFNDFRGAIGISANILSDRLERLVASGVFKREATSSDAAARDYRLTAKGLDLFGTLIALQDWADAWVSERYRSPVRIVHRRCGQVFHAASHCGGCGQAIMLGGRADLMLASRPI